MIPSKLKVGDHIQVVSPSYSRGIISFDNQQLSIRRLNEIGFSVGLSSNDLARDSLDLPPLESRINDLHRAFQDENTKAIITTIGGYNSNQLLSYLDYELIKDHPKIICGYSDITALNNAIFAKTGLVTYLGPNFSSFGMIKGFDYTLDLFLKCLCHNEPYEILPSSSWSDDRWYLDQKNRTFYRNSGYQVINSGEAEGIILGGHLRTFNILQGTPYFPDLSDSILLIEETEEVSPNEFDRCLQSLIHQYDFYKVRALVIGRFQVKSKMNDSLLREIIKSKNELRNIPVIANIDFGHTSPKATFPIGGRMKLVAYDDNVSIRVTQH